MSALPAQAASVGLKLRESCSSLICVQIQGFDWYLSFFLFLCFVGRRYLAKQDGNLVSCINILGCGHSLKEVRTCVGGYARP